MTANEWNKKYPIGTSVIVVRDSGERFPTKTRSEAWNLDSGTPVVKVLGIAGGYRLSRVEPAPQKSKRVAA